MCILSFVFGLFKKVTSLRFASFGFFVFVSLEKFLHSCPTLTPSPLPLRHPSLPSPLPPHPYQVAEDTGGVGEEGEGLAEGAEPGDRTEGGSERSEEAAKRRKLLASREAAGGGAGRGGAGGGEGGEGQGDAALAGCFWSNVLGGEQWVLLENVRMCVCVCVCREMCTCACVGRCACMCV